MKKIITTSILGFIICTAFNKPNISVTDYRDAYVGTYTCNQYSNTLNSRTMAYTSSTSTVSFSIVKDATDSIMQIRLGAETLKAKLVSSGLQPYPITVTPYIYGGRFFAGATDSLDFFYRPNKALSLRLIGKKTGP